MKSILITGAGTGIGKATAIKMAENGLAVVLVGRRKEPLEALKSQLSGTGHSVLSVDVSNKEDLNQSLNNGEMEGRDLYAVFANAGIGGANEYGESDRWEEIINVNLSGVYYTIMECLPFLKKSKAEFKHITVTSSCLARFGVPYYSAYCASKSGVTGLVRALAVELSSEKILVNAILPGWVDTKMARDGIQLIADSEGRDFEDTLKEQMGFVPMKKMSKPREIADLVAFLIQEGQSSITGQSMDINGGSFMI